MSSALAKDSALTKGSALARGSAWPQRGTRHKRRTPLCRHQGCRRTHPLGRLLRRGSAKGLAPGRRSAPAMVGEAMEEAARVAEVKVKAMVVRAAAAAARAMSRQPEWCDRGSKTVSSVLPTRYHSSPRLSRIACVRPSSNPWLLSMNR